MHKLFFLVVVMLLFGLLDFYIWQAIKFLMRNYSNTTRVTITILYWALPAIVVIGNLLRWAGLIPVEERYFRLVVLGSFMLNFLPKLIMFLFVLISDLVRGGKFVVEEIIPGTLDLPKGKTIPRSEFILKSGLAISAIPFAATSFGILSGAHDYRVRRKTIYFPNLPKAFDGIRVGQLSDIHSGSFFNKVAVQGGVDLLNSEKPDIVFFTGDLVNDRASEVRDYIDVFNKVKSPLGVHSILGNHDYGMYVQWPNDAAKLKNIQQVILAHKEMGWDIMLNQNKEIVVDNERIALLGVENWGEGFIKAGDLDKTYKGTEDKEFKILLSHDPSHWRAQVLPKYNDIDLTLSGHTHGMQFGIEIGNFQWSPVQYKYKEWGGLYTEGNQHIYVNRGYGYLGMPARIGILPEVTILELKRG
jgi:uncharacterized protein